MVVTIKYLAGSGWRMWADCSTSALQRPELSLTISCLHLQSQYNTQHSQDREDSALQSHFVICSFYSNVHEAKLTIFETMFTNVYCFCKGISSFHVDMDI